ncbi:hypothetical protein KP77_08830 [Jeotgalibacillus alimentarius]|uniref:DUF2834 domain-containing protein n=1 Tax=Jeotgalibacillus alimentarius TaxID=135826 RepID=A0A0C2W434_9BACL|nr:hypothetical protein [Jeotgalibacillus alimentarius]KIL51371.1 hypothetical protein KP77_08830 [Jeotgalibacillus alimentarius]
MKFIIVWLLLLSYALFFAPGSEGSDPVMESVLAGNWTAIDPLVLTVFNSLGIFPLVFLTILLRNDRQKWPAWPFSLAAFAGGAFALLPWFAFGDRSAKRGLRTPRWLLRILKSKVWLILLLVMIFGNLLTLLQGFSPAAYGDAFMESSLVSVMTVDWFILWWLSVEAINRFYPDVKNKGLAWIPIAGPVLVLFFVKDDQ